ncbi:MAG: aryl-sulfate sulfotransferase [Ignavibacteriae bacterium]|nr:aryl-sulfate sulfotransferase [Ignavibacteriota bacterium]
MKRNLYRFVLALIILFSTNYSYSQNHHPERLVYTSPKNNSLYNMETTSIIIGFDDYQDLEDVRLIVQGSSSGYHRGKVKVLINNPTKISFTPDKPFKFRERVTVTGYDHDESFTFFIRNEAVGNQRNLVSERLNQETQSLKPVVNNYQSGYRLFDTIPVVDIHQYGQTAAGNLFLINFNNISILTSYLLILNNDGTTKYAHNLKYRGLDFKRQNNYYLYWDEEYYHYRALDSGFNVVDSFYCGNGYITDFHECILEPDNSAWLMSYDPEVVDMSQIYPGGKTNATVTGLIIQKINANKDVVFQWRSWDYMSILDATHEDFQSYAIDYVHGNSIEVDKDGNIIISSRHLDEITKINSETGDFIWRFGGKNNQFTFLNDTAHFSHQHSARRLANDNILLFDNGNFHNPLYSRAVEYKLDLFYKTADIIWEYRNTPEIYSMAMGNVQRLANGNTLIGWGMNTTTISEVGPDKSLRYTLSLPEGQWSYRGFRYNTIDVLTNTTPSDIIIKDYKLSQNYPNPFNPVTRINFAIPKSGLVSIKVYDMLGKEVAVLVNEVMNNGSYTVNFNGSALSSGIYFYKISVNDFSDVKKMMLIK